MATNWSYSDLVREHGEDTALAMLQYQTGYGQFDMGKKKSTEDEPERCPLCGDRMDSTRPCGGNVNA